jgi:hypothetical protein
MAPPAVGTGTLRRLGELDTGGLPVLSVYLGLSDARDPSARETKLDALMTGVRWRAVAADVNRVHELLRSMPALAYGTRSMALFSSAEGSAFAAVPLPSAVEPMAIIDTLPWLEPLAGMFTSGDRAVSVIDRRTARLFRGGPQMLVEFASVHDGRHRKPAPGDGSQPDCPCATEEHLTEHLRRLAALLLRAHRRRAFDQLVVIAPSELWPAIEVVLHSDLRSRLVGLADLDLMDARAQEITRAVAQHVQRDRTTCRGRSNRTGLPIPVAVSTTHHANTLVLA